jgi:hypothetical protein
MFNSKLPYLVRNNFVSNRITYDICEFGYKFLLPKKFRDHREFFKKESRGFGEDAFHFVWYRLFKKIHPKRCLEIGVYRGQVISLWELLSKHLGYSAEVWGITPLNNLGDDVSNYPTLNYGLEIKNNYNFFKLDQPKLLQNSSESNEASTFIKTGEWDLIYIDGNHNYNNVLNDYINSNIGLNCGGFLVLDDSSLYLNYRPKKGSFKGHHGPSQILIEKVANEMQHMLTIGHLNIFQKKS